MFDFHRDTAIRAFATNTIGINYCVKLLWQSTEKFHNSMFKLKIIEFFLLANHTENVISYIDLEYLAEHLRFADLYMQ